MAFIALAHGEPTRASSHSAPEDRVGEELRTEALPLLGEPAQLKLAPAKARVVIFWASWCPYCKQARSYLDQLQKKYSAKGLSIVGISTDESRDAAEGARKKFPTDFPDAYAGPARFKDLTVELPVMIVLDSKGRTRAAYSGFSGERAYYLNKQLRPLLGLTED